jgi:hypothetical protein
MLIGPGQNGWGEALAAVRTLVPQLIHSGAALDGSGAAPDPLLVADLQQVVARVVDDPAVAASTVWVMGQWIASLIALASVDEPATAGDARTVVQSQQVMQVYDEIEQAMGRVGY